MASDKDEANPFSYKAFISKREKGKEGEKKKKSSSKGSDTLRTDMPFPEASTGKVLKLNTLECIVYGGIGFEH